MSSSHTKRDSDDLRVGRVLGGKYELREQIGAGGGGTVFRALQQNTGQDVAVKVQRLSEGLDGLTLSRQRTRFKREMEICARLHHPDIVRLIDFGEVDEGVSFSVFEFVPGRTLRGVLDSEGALKIDRALRLMGQLLVALAYAHAEGVIHRDLKPSNLMIVGEGARERIKILDFGIGTMPLADTGDPTRLTLTNEMVGTPAYAAPEQVRGESPTSKTDLYAWGLVLFETIVGQSAIKGSSLGEVLAQQLMPTPIALPDRLERHELGNLLRWVMQKNPARRAGSAEQLLARLEAIDVAELIDDNGYFVDSSKPSADLSIEATMTATVGARRGIEGERRQVSAVACRVQLRRRGEPVEFDLLDVYREDLLALCRATMHEFGGSDVGSLAGIAMFYFGVPVASDADARLAARATLELSARIQRRNSALFAQRRIEASLHAGIHTGLLTLDPLADRPIQNGTVATTAFELALLSPGAGESVIHVSDDFRELVERHAEFADEGSHGLSTAWRATLIPTAKLIGESGSALYAANVARLVGRERELALLFESWRERRPALLQAEAGMGKSRLAHEFHERVEREGQRRIELRFLPESRGVAFGPLLELFERELEDREQVLELLRTLTIPVDQALVLLRDGLALPIAAELERLPCSPLKQRTMLEQLLVEYLCALLSQRDAYLLLEDLHWADPTSLQWLDKLLNAAAGARRFVLLTARPDFTPPFEHELGRVELDALSDEQVAELVARLPIARELPRELIAQIVERADGIPLFAEELTRVFVGRKSTHDTAAVPASLRDLLMSRLDALGLARETAQIAAAIGREFEFELLAAVSDRDQGTLLGDLDQLISAGLIVRRPRIDHPSYLFRHALIRDAAYDSMTRESHARIHRMIAEALLAEFPERANARPELLALHYEKAELLDEATKYLLEAGQRAVARSEHVEALTHVGHGIELLGTLEDTPARRGQELRLRTVMIASSVATMGYAAEPVLVHSTRARELAQEFGDPPELLPALYGLWVYHLARGIRGTTEDYAQQVLGYVERNPDRLAEISAHFAHGTTLLYTADFAGAEAAFGRVIERYDPAEHVELIRVFGDDHGLFAMVYLYWQHALVGHVDQAKAFGERALELAERFDDSLAQAMVYVFGMLVSREFGEPEAALAFGERAIAVSTRHNYPFWLANGHIGTGWARVMLGADEAELPPMRQGLAFFDLIQQKLPLSYWSTNLVEACLKLGRLDEAGEVIDRALGLADQHLDVFYRPELERLAGELALARGELAEAESRFDRGIAIARTTGAHLLGLRAVVGKAGMMIARGETQPAAALLREACERVPGARETPFYAAARGLLAQCGS